MLGNVLFLRGDLEIRPPDRPYVTFEYLVERLGDYLLNHGPSDSHVSLVHIISLYAKERPADISTYLIANDDDSIVLVADFLAQQQQ